MIDIQLISTDDLIQEIKDRSDCIVIGFNTPDKVDDSKQIIHDHCKGDWLTCLGLLDYVREEIIKKYQRDDD